MSGAGRIGMVFTSRHANNNFQAVAPVTKVTTVAPVARATSNVTTLVRNARFPSMNAVIRRPAGSCSSCGN